MEEKESTTVSASLGDSVTSSDNYPEPVTSSLTPPQQAAMNINMNVDMAAVENDVVGIEGSMSLAVVRPPPSPTSIGGSGGVDLFGKKKRGRPRKYDSDGNLRVKPLHGTSGFSFSPGSGHHSLSSSKRGRGRPPGSGNWQLLASLGEIFANTAGGDFTPHVITVNTGEDVTEKILSFSQKGPRGICVLAANGVVSNITIRQPGSSGGILTYEGCFELLSLSGSFTITENGGVRSRTGGLSVSLASPDGRVIGGGVAGLLLAANPIQIVIGSFMPNAYTTHKRKQQHREQRMVPLITGGGAPDTVAAAATPISQAIPDRGETCLAPSIPAQIHEGTGNNNANDKQIGNAAISHSVFWNGADPTFNQRPSPDINVSLPCEEDFEGVFQRVGG